MGVARISSELLSGKEIPQTPMLCVADAWSLFAHAEERMVVTDKANATLKAAHDRDQGILWSSVSAC